MKSLTEALFDLWDQFEPQVIDEILENSKIVCNKLQQLTTGNN